MDIRVAREIEEQTLLAERQLYRSSFAEFVKAAWHLVEHKHPLIWGPHLDLICKTLERAYRREIHRVIFNVPPRSLKSSLISVLFNAWVWATEDKPTEQFLTISHSRDLVVRDARKSRSVIQSPWYKRLFPHVRIVSDQNQKMYFETEQGGHRNAQSMKQGISGKGGNIITIDDPHDAKKILIKDTDREYVTSTYEEAIESRLNNPDHDIIIIVMQRLHEGDLTGWVLKNRKHEGWVHICLPLEFEPDHPHRCIHDKRTKVGECLLPGRWSPKTIDGFKRKPVIWNGQYQQRPSVRGGEIFQRKAWQVWKEKDLPEIRYIMMSVDTAFKDGQDNDFSACTVWGLFINGETDDKNTYDMILLHGWQAKLRYGPLRERITMEYEKWVKRGLQPDIVLIEDKASGQSLIQEMSDAGVPGVVAYNPHSEQALFRAHLASDILDDGAIWVPGRLMADGKRDGEILVVWAEEVVNQCEQYPRGENDDLTTTCIQAWRYCRESGFIESSADVKDDMDFGALTTDRPTVYG